MKKLILAALLVLGLASIAQAADQDRTFVNGIDPNYPPFAYIDEKTGEPAGFDVESINWIAKKLGIKVQHKPMAWDGIIPSLLNKQIDLIASGMSITEKREKQVQFSNAYWEVSRVFLVRADSTLTPEAILANPTKVGVQRGTSEADAIKDEKKAKGYTIELRPYDSGPLAVEDLLNKRIDAVLLDSLPANDAIEKGRTVKICGTHGVPDKFGVAMRKDEKFLRNVIDEGYRLLQADPYWKELQNKYLNK